MLPSPDVIAIALFIAAALAAVFVAIFLRIAVKLALTFDVPFGQAFSAAFIFLVVTVAIAFLNGLGVALPSFSPAVTRLLSVGLDMLAGSVIFGMMIKLPNSTRSIGLGYGLVLSLVLAITGVAVCLAAWATWGLAIRP